MLKKISGIIVVLVLISSGISTLAYGVGGECSANAYCYANEREVDCILDEEETGNTCEAWKDGVSIRVTCGYVDSESATCFTK